MKNSQHKTRMEILLERYDVMAATMPDNQILLMCSSGEFLDIPLDTLLSQFKYCCSHDECHNEKIILKRALEEIIGEKQLERLGV